MTLRTAVRRHAVERADRHTGVDEQRLERRRDGGFSFIEIVITITLLGIVVVPILVAVAASIRASTVSLATAEVETVLVNSVDRVNRSTRARFPCDLTSPVVAAVETHGWSPSSATVRHEFLDSSGAWQTDATGTACPGGISHNGLIQRITVDDHEPGGRCEPKPAGSEGW